MKNIGIKKRSIVLNGVKTSVSVEDVFWNRFERIAVKMEMTRTNLISLVEKHKPSNSGLSSAIRCYVMREALVRLGELDK